MSTENTVQAHQHRCQKCGTIWGHGDIMLGDITAHKCPTCGSQEWRVYTGGKPLPKQYLVKHGNASPVWMNRDFWMLVFFTAGVTLVLLGFVEFITGKARR